MLHVRACTAVDRWQQRVCWRMACGVLMSGIAYVLGGISDTDRLFSELGRLQRVDANGSEVDAPGTRRKRVANDESDVSPLELASLGTAERCITSVDRFCMFITIPWEMTASALAFESVERMLRPGVAMTSRLVPSTTLLLSLCLRFGGSQHSECDMSGTLRLLRGSLLHRCASPLRPLLLLLVISWAAVCSRDDGDQRRGAQRHKFGGWLHPAALSVWNWAGGVGGSPLPLALIAVIVPVVQGPGGR